MKSTEHPVFASVEAYTAAPLETVAAALPRLAFGERLDSEQPSVEAGALVQRVAKLVPGANARIVGDASGHARANQVTEEAPQHLELNALVMRQYFYTENLHLSLTRKGRAALTEAS